MERLYYYTAPPFQSNPATVDEKRRKAGYDRFVAAVTRNRTVIVREGRCQRVDGHYTQKGVDTLLTMDLMSVPFAHPETKTVCIVACDTDFVPVIQQLRKQGFEIVLVYYTDRVRGGTFSMSNELLHACEERLLLNRDILKATERVRK